MLANENGIQQIGGIADELILKQCGILDQGIIGAHRWPGCGAHIHFFCGDVLGEKLLRHMR